MSDSIHVKFPDGSTKEIAKGTTALDVAKSISPRLADAALAAKTNGNLIDLTRPLEKDTDLRILTDKDPEALEVYRHSSAHLMAAAVLELFPETKLGHGPATENGFFYDFYRRDSVHAGRSGKDREEDAGTGEAGLAVCARVCGTHGGAAKASKLRATS